MLQPFMKLIRQIQGARATLFLLTSVGQRVYQWHGDIFQKEDEFLMIPVVVGGGGPSYWERSSIGDPGDTYSLCRKEVRVTALQVKVRDVGEGVGKLLG